MTADHRTAAGDVPARPPRRLGYVELGVEDVAATRRFFERHVGLWSRDDVEDDGAVHLTGGGEHHWIVLRESPTPGLARLAYEVDSPADLDAARDVLEAAGASTADVEAPAVAAAFDVEDPDGLPLRLYTGMDHDAAPRRARWTNHEALLHVGLSVDDAPRSERFYTEQLGFKVSDRVGGTGAFLRSANGYHHSLVVLQRGNPRLEHICFLMRSFDDLMRARELLRRDGVELQADLIRHAPSSSVAIYVPSPVAGVTVELCVWHDVVDDSWRPRTLVSSPWAYNQWTPPPDVLAP